MTRRDDRQGDLYGKHQASLLDLDAGIDRKDDGVLEVSSHNEGWLETVRQAMKELSLDRGRERGVSAEDVRVWCEQMEWWPDHHNCYGAVFRPTWSPKRPERAGWRMIGTKKSAVVTRNAGRICQWVWYQRAAWRRVPA